jgi:DNA-binding transcriptional regulator YiaG
MVGAAVQSIPMAVRRATSASRRRLLTPEDELTAIKARAAGLRRLITARHQFSPAAVRKHRHRLDITATQYGQLLGVSMQTVFGWEKGRSRPRPQVLLRWVDLLRTPDKDALARLGLNEVQPVLPRQLKAERKRLGLSQARYGALVGVHQAAVSAWESGEKEPGREGLEAARDVGHQQGCSAEESCAGHPCSSPAEEQEGRSPSLP